MKRRWFNPLFWGSYFSLWVLSRINRGFRPLFEHMRSNDKGVDEVFNPFSGSSIFISIVLAVFLLICLALLMI